MSEESDVVSPQTQPFVHAVELSRRCYFGQVRPFVAREFPALNGRIAATVLHGSQSLEADDEQSRDHGWGVEFDLLLTDSDFASHGSELKSKVNTYAREHWLGFQLPEGARNWHACRKPGFIDAQIGIYAIGERLGILTGATEPPQKLAHWVSLNRTGLYYLKYAPVIDDPLGEWTRGKQAFKAYPEPVRAKLVADALFEFWHYGAYNYLCRVAARGDAVTMAIALGHFAEATMALWFLLNREFWPYWKWLHHEFLKQPQHELIEPALQRLLRSTDERVRIEAVTQICKVMCQRLVAEGFMQQGDQNNGLNTVVDKIRATLKHEFGAV